MSGDGRVDIWYVVERLRDVKTQKDLDGFIKELENVRVDYDETVARIPDYDVYSAIDDVKRDYIERALKAADGKFTKAADLLGLKNHQTFKNWYTRLSK
jgi:transcriptional regulator with GAF, ATPase, and Fis domain